NVCHFQHFPTESCAQALANHVGLVSTDMHFQRVAYDATIADRYRVGSIVNPNGSDLSVRADAIQEEHSVFYRYFDQSSCEVGEGASPGWRRLLTFSAVVENDGTKPIHIGDVTDRKNPYTESHVFEFSPCHAHYHFTHYGTFSYAGAPGSKKAFCLEDTNR